MSTPSRGVVPKLLFAGMLVGALVLGPHVADAGPPFDPNPNGPVPKPDAKPTGPLVTRNLGFEAIDKRDRPVVILSGASTDPALRVNRYEGTTTKPTEVVRVDETGLHGNGRIDGFSTAELGVVSATAYRYTKPKRVTQLVPATSFMFRNGYNNDRFGGISPWVPYNMEDPVLGVGHLNLGVTAFAVADLPERARIREIEVIVEDRSENDVLVRVDRFAHQDRAKTSLATLESTKRTGVFSMKATTDTLIDVNTSQLVLTVSLLRRTSNNDAHAPTIRAILLRYDVEMAD